MWGETMAVLVVIQNLWVKTIIPTSENIMGKRRENVMRTITDRQVQNVVNKNNLQDSI